MALSATPYRFLVSLSNTDSHVYAELKFVIARHPSETEDRLLTRLLAYLLWYHEQVEFGRGLSDSDEAALWQIGLDGQIEHWIDVGLPDAERMTKAARKSKKYALLVYGNRRIWQDKELTKAIKSEMEILAVPEEVLAGLKPLLSRNMKIELTVADDTFYLTVIDGMEHHSIVFQFIALHS